LSGEELRGLAEEQGALRRVATLVARGAAPEEVFAAVTREIGQLLPVEYAYMSRYEPDRTVVFVTAWGRGGANLLGDRTRVPLGGNNLSTTVFETGRSGRMDDYGRASGPAGVAAREGGVRSAVATPILVEGRLWGMMAAGSSGEEPLPADTEERLAQFTELLAAAIANAESRAGLTRLAEEQAALRRVATLVACGSPSEELFAAVPGEVGRLLQAGQTAMIRYESDGTATLVAAWSRTGDSAPLGARERLGGNNLTTIIWQTRRPARIDSYADASGAPAVVARKVGFRSAAGAPVIVRGRLWGAMIVGSVDEQPLGPGTEARLASFTELVATAISNAENLAELTASRARVVAAADETRRRIERDLHDGAQQRLVSLSLALRVAQAEVPPQLGELESELGRVADGLASVQEDLREMAHGIHPAILAQGGLGRALKILARRSAVPVKLDVRGVARLPERIEVAAYYVVSEALTNAAKHAHASVIQVQAETAEGALQLRVRDDGAGGADPIRGSGLLGLKDRVEALGGTLEVTSPAGSGTTLLIEIPVEGQRSALPPEP
jgi:signal transduction histidine kinase